MSTMLFFSLSEVSKDELPGKPASDWWPQLMENSKLGRMLDPFQYDIDVTHAVEPYQGPKSLP